MAFKDVLVGKKPVKSNIFAKYFLLFAAIFLVTLTVLGTALTLMVNAYSQNERTNLLKENVQSVSGTISSSLIMQDINSRYSVEKRADVRIPVYYFQLYRRRCIRLRCGG